jgi:hypothetical protein
MEKIPFDKLKTFDLGQKKSRFLRNAKVQQCMSLYSLLSQLSSAQIHIMFL